MSAFEAETLESCHSPASFRPNYSAPSRSLRSGPHCPEADLAFSHARDLCVQLFDLDTGRLC
ncbi:MAG: hypothetical protein ACJ8A4_22420, partial [Microvirga sp.]